MNKFLTTPFGDFLKNFFVLYVGLILFKIEQGMNVFDMNWRTLIELGIPVLIATAKVGHSWVNRWDPRYGKQPRLKDMPPDPPNPKIKS